MSANRTFEFNNRTLAYDDYAVVTSQRYPNGRLVQRRGTARETQVFHGYIYGQNYHVEDNGDGVPRLVPGDRAYRGKVWHPRARKWIVIGSREYFRWIEAGWVQVGDSFFVPPNRFRRLRLTGSLAEMRAQVRAFNAPMGGLFLIQPGKNGRSIRVRRGPPYELAYIFGAISDLEGEYEARRVGELFEETRMGLDPLEGYVLAAPSDDVVRAQFLAGAPAARLEIDPGLELCVRRALEELFPKRDWSWVPPNCGWEEMVKIAKRAKIVIRLFTQWSWKEPAYEWGRVGARNNRPVANLWYSFYHVEALPHGPPDFNKRLADPVNDVTFYDDLPTNVRAFHTTRNPALLITAEVKLQPEIYGFIEVDRHTGAVRHHKVRFMGHELAPEVWSVTGAAFKLLKRDHGDIRVPTHLRAIQKHIPLNAILYTRPLAEGQLLHYYDEVDAYRTCYLLQDGGFPDLQSASNAYPGLPSYVDADGQRVSALDTMEGLCMITDIQRNPDLPPEEHARLDTLLHPHVFVFGPDHLYPFSMVRYQLSLNTHTFEVAFSIVYKRTMRDPFEAVREVMDEISESRADQKLWFHRVVGRAQQHSVPDVRTATTEWELNELLSTGYQVIRQEDLRATDSGAEQPDDNTDGGGDDEPFDPDDPGEGTSRGPVRRRDREINDNSNNSDGNTSGEAVAEAPVVDRIYVCRSNELTVRIPYAAVAAAYVHGGQIIQLHKDFLSKIPAENIYRVWVDGVGTNEPIPSHLLPPANRYRYEGLRAFNDHSSDVFARQLKPVPFEDWPHLDPAESFHPVFHEPRIVLCGAAGTGKTHTIGTYLASDPHECLLLAGTNRAARILSRTIQRLTGKKVEVMTVQKFAVLLEHKPHEAARLLANKERVIIDEWTMIKHGKRTIELFLQHKLRIVLSGDPRQLGVDKDPPTMEWLAERGFVAHRLTTIHRTVDPEMLELYIAARTLSQEELLKRIPRGALRFPAHFLRAHVLASTNERRREINALYIRLLFPNCPIEDAGWGPDATGVCPKVGIGPGMLVVGVKTNKDFAKGEIGFIVDAVDRDHVLVRSEDTSEEVVVPIKNLNPGYALTFHQCQGDTYDFPLHIVADNLFDLRMLYTAVTRPTRFEYLTLGP